MNPRKMIGKHINFSGFLLVVGGEYINFEVVSCQRWRCYVKHFFRCPKSWRNGWIKSQSFFSTSGSGKTFMFCWSPKYSHTNSLKDAFWPFKRNSLFVFSSKHFWEVAQMLEGWAFQLNKHDFVRGRTVVDMYIYTHIHTPRVPMTSIFEGQPPQNKAFSTQNKGHLMSFGFQVYIIYIYTVYFLGGFRDSWPFHLENFCVFFVGWVNFLLPMILSHTSRLALVSKDVPAPGGSRLPDLEKTVSLPETNIFSTWKLMVGSDKFLRLEQKAYFQGRFVSFGEGTVPQPGSSEWPFGVF